MNTINILKIGFLSGLFLMSFSSKSYTSDTVSYVDLQRYQGLWYEIARIPNSFQKKCLGNVTAEYSIQANGKVKVENSCLTKDGSITKAIGQATVDDTQTNSRLKVSFFNLFGLWLFSGDYWIIDLDQNYQWALIGSPKKNYSWILSRTPDMDNQVLATLMQSLKDRGYNTCLYWTTIQTGGNSQVQNLCELFPQP